LVECDPSIFHQFQTSVVFIGPTGQLVGRVEFQAVIKRGRAFLYQNKIIRSSFDEILPAIWAQSIIENEAFNPLPII
jgi:hypothetical protein